MRVGVKRGKPLKRTRGARPEQRRFLIYCEGECTEHQYFKGLRAELRALPVAVCLGGEHGEPKSLVKAAIEHKNRAPSSASDRWTAYDEVWCVIDVEAPVPHEGLADALKLARRNGIEVALTNPLLRTLAAAAFSGCAGVLHVGRGTESPEAPDFQSARRARRMPSQAPVGAHGLASSASSATPVMRCSGYVRTPSAVWS
ncbi:RloB family protein [Streptomyces sp. NPDC001279]|uniref:RloB family protein n=1 Tax=Streptomyces sp. NPDC001279 TaxID=3364556 RepID=UPI0036B54D0C